MVYNSYIINFIYITAYTDYFLGGLFETSTENTIDYQESAFRYAIRMASEKFKNDNFEFETSIKTYKFEGNSLEAGKSGRSLFSVFNFGYDNIGEH